MKRESIFLFKSQKFHIYQNTNPIKKPKPKQLLRPLILLRHVTPMYVIYIYRATYLKRFNVRIVRLRIAPPISHIRISFRYGNESLVVDPQFSPNRTKMCMYYVYVLSLLSPNKLYFLYELCNLLTITQPTQRNYFSGDQFVEINFPRTNFSVD